MPTRLTSLLLFMLFLATACQQKPGHGIAQEVESTHQDSAIYTLPGMGVGLIQSPINIFTKNLGVAGKTDIAIYGEMHPEADEIINKGHTVELEFNHNTYIDFNGERFTFYQAHFHTPSEHLIDGITFPMELHFVNVKEDEAGNPVEYLVIAAMFKMGDESKFIASFIDRIPEHTGDTADISDNPVMFDDIFGPDRIPEDRHYYSYKGSLTTPPYTESVNWLIIQEIFEASPEQISYINELEGDNARHVQALYGRRIRAN